MFWIEQKYISLLSSRLALFKKTGTSYNFRCPYCGDSQKNKFKTRGYLIQRDRGYSYYCHNCGETASLKQFIKHIDPTLYAEYLTEAFKETKQPDQKQVDDSSWKTVPKFTKSSPLKKLKKISQLAPDHPAKLYLIDRQMPNITHSYLYYAPNFSSWVNETLGFEKLSPDDKQPRLVIPFLDKEKNIFGFQGRSFSDKGIRYISIMLDETKDKCFGLDRVDEHRTVYVFEGPIDSMFINNSIAMAGSAGKVDFDDVVFVYDNEPRNEQIIDRMHKVVDNGRKICVWPEQLGWKDVNDMILGGLTVDQIKKFIDDNTYDGLKATLAITKWKKV
jgi:transcription elongation factor Elf1